MAWGKVRTVYLVSATEAALNVMLSLALVTRLGPAGVALGTLLPQVFLSLVVVPRLACRLVGDSPGFYYLNIAKGAALCAALTLIGRAAVAAAGGGLWTALAIGLLAAVLYALLYAVLLLGVEERKKLVSYARIAIRGLARGAPASAQPPY